MTRIDARGMRCPWPAIRLARALREQAATAGNDPASAAIEILADDPAAPRELRAVADAAGVRFEQAAPHRFQLFFG